MLIYLEITSLLILLVMCLSCFVNRFEFTFLDLSIFLIADCRAISMGQGQEIHARKLVGQFMQTVSIRCIVFPCIEVQCLLFLFAFFVFFLIVFVVENVSPGFHVLSLCWYFSPHLLFLSLISFGCKLLRLVLLYMYYCSCMVLIWNTFSHIVH